MEMSKYEWPKQGVQVLHSLLSNDVIRAAPGTMNSVHYPLVIVVLFYLYPFLFSVRYLLHSPRPPF